MTAPIWAAAPPEVHSALLSSGPGAGPLLAAAAAWSSLSTSYAETAQDLAAVLAAVQAGGWDGPTAQTYVAAHLPYLGWLIQAGADSAAMAARQETAATAWTAALAAMPTLAELAANHVTHAVLVATNFFGINTIPIALNEADYVRMWIQAATVMTTYQGIATAVVDTAPQTTAAPDIVTTGALAAADDLPPDRQTDFYQWLTDIGYIDFYDNYIQPLIDALSNLPFFQALFSGFDPYLVILGNPLTYFSPFNVAFALGYPMDIGTYVLFLSQMFSFVALDLTAAFASGNPTTIGFTILFVTVEIIGTVITDTIALLKTLLEQTIVLLAVVVPLLTAPLVPLAAGAVLAPIGIKGLAALAVAPPAPPVAPPVSPPLAALAPSVPTSTSSPAPAPAEVTGSAPAPPALPPTAAPPTFTGTGVGMGLGAGMENFGYLVGDLGSVTRKAAVAAARKKAPDPDSAQEPTAAPAPEEPAGTPRRRRAKVAQLGRGYEYMDLEPEVTASETGATSMGFAGTAAGRGARATGLTTLADHEFGGGPRIPMLPGTWEGEHGER
ncbi:PPE family protein [Mycobacterium paragordonae]|uniref:PPE family protein n=1 Tax=Mycobacterium paragordonae TaxID=1389713 RepID=A0ABQ1C424_9MYCO|nr:PPE family protein [Mycobacterium paragordonae]AYE95774.1 PPE family protein [Mycobacterium paragordonae]GFG79057.1 PPE family protein [Mycobacterium paragordonae]